MSPISVIIPVLNEAESIGHVVSSMPWDRIAECIVVDNGSTDDTAAIAEAAGARVITSPRGYGAACWAGSQAALPASTVLVFMDGDGSDVIEYLSLLVNPILNDEADFVIGSRLLGHHEPGSLLVSQIFAARFVDSVLRVAMLFSERKVRYTDMGPFRAIRRSSFEKLNMMERTYGWNLEMQIKAIKHRLHILEIPVDYRRRIGGVSKVSGNFKASFIAGYRIFRVLRRIGLARQP